MFVSAPPESEATAGIYKASRDDAGFVMNYTRLWAWRPDVLAGYVALRTKLTDDASLGASELAVIVCATAASLGDSYCSLAWGRKLAAASDPASAAAIIQGGPAPALSPRDRALAAWTRKVVNAPNDTTAADVARLREAGFSEREIVEATMFAAFRLAFSTVNDALGAEPDWQLAELAPPKVVAAVTFGRPSAGRQSA